MARHLVHRRNGQVDEYQELPDTEHLGTPVGLKNLGPAYLLGSA